MPALTHACKVKDENEARSHEETQVKKLILTVSKRHFLLAFYANSSKLLSNF